MSAVTSEIDKATELPETWSGEMKALLVLGLPMAAAQLVQFSIYFRRGSARKRALFSVLDVGSRSCGHSNTSRQSSVGG